MADFAWNMHQGWLNTSGKTPEATMNAQLVTELKRAKGNIQSSTVQQVRGSLGAHEQGLIITTSDFSTRAIKEANQPDKTPVGLMNGDQLVTLLTE